MRVLPNEPSERFIYGLEVKRDFRRQVRYECPAALSLLDTTVVEMAALEAFRVLGCRDVARVDFRLRDGVPYFLEINPLPGLTPGWSDLVLIAQGCGMDYRGLIGEILSGAIRRYKEREARRAQDRLSGVQRPEETKAPTLELRAEAAKA